jgi:hypothetical protein
MVVAGHHRCPFPFPLVDFSGLEGLPQQLMGLTKLTGPSIFTNFGHY